jgi:hypothetical protein
LKRELKTRLPAPVHLPFLHVALFDVSKGLDTISLKNWYVIQTFSNLHANVEVWKIHKLVQSHKFMELDFGLVKVSIKIGIKLCTLQLYLEGPVKKMKYSGQTEGWSNG